MVSDKTPRPQIGPLALLDRAGPPLNAAAARWRGWVQCYHRLVSRRARLPHEAIVAAAHREFMGRRAS